MSVCRSGISVCPCVCLSVVLLVSVCLPVSLLLSASIHRDHNSHLCRSYNLSSLMFHHSLITCIYCRVHWPLWNLPQVEEKCHYGCICPCKQHIIAAVDTVLNSWSTLTQLAQPYWLITARPQPHTHTLGATAAVLARGFIYSTVFHPFLIILFFPHQFSTVSLFYMYCTSHSRLFPLTGMLH